MITESNNPDCFSNFVFLKRRYKPGFFASILNKYFVLLAYFARQTDIKLEDLIGVLLHTLFTDDIIELNKYGPEIIYNIIEAKDKLRQVSKLEFFALESDDQCIATVIYLYLKKLKLDNKKKSAYFDMISLMFNLQFLFKDDRRSLKIWKTSALVCGVLKSYSIEEIHNWFDITIKEIEFRREYATEKKLLPGNTIILLAEYETFIHSFVSDIKPFINGPVQLKVSRYYMQFRKNLIHFNQIKILINTGIL